MNKPIKLVLVGGGHSHAIAIILWSKQPLPNVELTLISDVENTPYSGMLPGYVAGFYTYEETHINLPHLASIAGAKLIIDRAMDLDLVNERVICEYQAIDFDYLSLDIGSTPQTSLVPGASEFAVAVKPVPLFLNTWNQLLETVKNNPQLPLKIALIGGGAGGVELAFNMHSHLRKIKDKKFWGNLEITLIHRGENLLSSHSQKVSKLVTKLLKKTGIKLYLQTKAIAINRQQIICQNKVIINTDYIFLVTQADSPQWIKSSFLAKDARGFVLVNNYLQSISHPHILATGDIATIENYPRPKAGVFAVRQGKPLYNNWQNTINKKPLQPYIPQEKYLALIGTGTQKAIASWGDFCWQSSLFWSFKNYIDRQFMKQFT